MKALIIHQQEVFEKEIFVEDLRFGYFDYALYLKSSVFDIEMFLVDAKKINNFSFSDYKYIYKYDNGWWFWEFDFSVWEDTADYHYSPEVITDFRKMVDEFVYE